MAQPIDWKLFGIAAENVEKQAAGLPGVPQAQDMLDRNPGSPPKAQNLPDLNPGSPPKAQLMPYKPEGPYQASQSGGGSWWGAKQGPPGGAPGAQAGSMGPSRGAAGDADLQAAMQFTAQNQPNYMHDTFIPSIRNIPLAGGALAHLAGQLAGPDPRGRANQGQAGQAQAGSSGQAAGGTSGGQFSIPSQRLPQPGFGGRPAQPVQPVAPNPYDTTPDQPNANWSIPAAPPGTTSSPIPPGSKGGYIPSDADEVTDAINKARENTYRPNDGSAAPVNPGPDGQAGTADDGWQNLQDAWDNRPQQKKQRSQQGGGFGPQVMQFIRSMFGPGGGMQFPGAWPGMMMPRMMMPQWPGGGGFPGMMMPQWPGGGGGMMFPQQQQQQQPWRPSRQQLETWRDKYFKPAAPSNKPGATPAAPSNEPGATPAAPGGGMVNPVPTGDEPSQYDQEMYALNRPDNQDPFSGPGGTSGLKPDVQEGFPAEWFESESAEQPAAPELPEAELPEPESPATETTWPSVEEPPATWFDIDPGMTPKPTERPDSDPGMTPPSPKFDPGDQDTWPGPGDPSMDINPSQWGDVDFLDPDLGKVREEPVADYPAQPPLTEAIQLPPADLSGPSVTDEDIERRSQGGRLPPSAGSDKLGPPQSPTEWNDKEWMDNLREQGERGNLA